jgi:hypothetical protein
MAHGLWLFLATYLSSIIVNGLVAVGISLSFDPSAMASVAGILSCLTVAVLSIKIVGAAIAFRVAWKKGLLEWPALREFLIFWLVFAGAALGLVAILLPDQGLPLPKSIAFLGIATFLPLGRFALLPLGFEWHRHR